MTTHYPPKSFNEYETKVKKWANHIIIFLLGLFVGISMYLLELPIPLQGTIYKISEAPQKHEKSVLTSKTKGSYAIGNPNQIRYRIDCELSDTDIILSNGYKAHLLEGMKVQGHLYLYRRKIIEFILDQIDQWLCPASLRGT